VIPTRRGALALIAALVSAGAAAPAAAEVGTTFSVWSDELFRGRSLSGGRPVATLDVSYDDVGGAYLGASGTAVATAHEGARFLGVQGNIGYAYRVSPRGAIDLGITDAHYTEYYSGGRNADHVEAYAGFVTAHFSTHIHYSPHYFASGVSAVYADVDGVLPIGEKWRLTGHVGLLRRMNGAPHNRTALDGRAGIARRIGPFDLQLNLSAGGARASYAVMRNHEAARLNVGLTCTF
jgi:uncharacterized protein (TIGR02001 family)